MSIKRPASYAPKARSGCASAAFRPRGFGATFARFTRPLESMAPRSASMLNRRLSEFVLSPF